MAGFPLHDVRATTKNRCDAPYLIYLIEKTGEKPLSFRGQSLLIRTCQAGTSKRTRKELQFFCIVKVALPLPSKIEKDAI